jgi:hypothetical protein
VSLSACHSSSSEPAPTSSTDQQSVALDWQVEGIDNSSGYAYFNVLREMTLSEVVIDASLTPASTSGISGALQVHCRACVTKGSTFPGTQGVTSIAGTSTDFGSVLLHNPGELASTSDEGLLQDVFYSVILQSTVSARGSSSATQRSFKGEPGMSLRPGDLLVFEIEHDGLPGNVGLEVLLSYS